MRSWLILRGPELVLFFLRVELVFLVVFTNVRSRRPQIHVSTTTLSLNAEYDRFAPVVYVHVVHFLNESTVLSMFLELVDFSCSGMLRFREGCFVIARIPEARP